MDIFEYQAKELFKEFNINVLKGFVTSDVLEAVNIAKRLGGDSWAIKAQVHAGGRGAGGGVKIAKSLEEVEKFSKEILGMQLITSQTSKEGKLVKQIYIEQGCKYESEFYLAFAFNRAKEKITLISSKNGGIEIEENLKDSIKIIDIDPLIGLRDFHIYEVAKFLDIKKELVNDFFNLLNSLFRLYNTFDATLVEINPLVISQDKFIALDAKMSFDDSALFRQERILSLRDFDEENPNELEAKEYGLSYIKLDGNIGCIVNGAGLAMGTMDTLKYYGGNSANFLDVGGKTNQDAVAKALEIILRDKNVKTIFVNIFGGIVRCDLIAEGILKAKEKLDIKIPLVIRLNGTNSDIAKKMLSSSGIKNLYSATDLDDGAKMAVEFAKKGIL